MARVLPSLLALWACLLVPSGARATVLAEVPLDDMIHDSDGIAMGEVTRVTTQMLRREDGRLEPWTATTLRVDRWLKGGSDDTVTVHERGGHWQGGGMRIAGTPEYRVGERAVVFLWRDPLGRLRTYGMVQGRYVIRAGVAGVATTVERDLHDAGFARWSGGVMNVIHLPSEPMPLAELLARIEHVLAVTR